MSRQPGTDVGAELDRVWRAEAASMLAVLSRRLGTLDLAEEALQEALTEALKRWADDGVPDHPAERWLREAKVLQIVEGTNQVQRLVIGRSL